jgi:hypothetical protein
MKKVQILILSVLFIFPSIINNLYGQDLVDISFFRSQELRKQLGLNFEQTQKMESSLLYFGEAYKHLMTAEYDENQTFQEKYELLKKEREKELKTFLDARQLDLFNVIQKQRIEYFKDFYESTRLKLAENTDLANELATYDQNIMLPELLRFRAQLDEVIEAEDSLKLIELSGEFNEILDDLLAEENFAQFTSSSNISKSLKKYSKKDAENKKNFKAISKMLKKYKRPLNDIALEIDPLEIKWRKDIISIVNKYLPVEEQEAFSNILNLIGAYGISQKIDPLVFLLFDPANDQSYFVLKRKLFRIFFKDRI